MSVFVDFNKKNLCTPEVVIRPCFSSMAISNLELFPSLRFVFEERNISKSQTWNVSSVQKYTRKVRQRLRFDSRTTRDGDCHVEG